MTRARSFRGLVAALWIVTLAAWPPAPAGAQPIPAHPRDLRFEPLAFDPPEAASHRHVLSNGVVAYVVPDRTLPLVTVSVLVRTGSYLEPSGKAGLASLVGGQMRAGGTAALTPGDFDEEVAFLAANVRSGIDDTVGRASMNCLTKDLDQTLDLFFEMLRHPRFDPDRLDLAKSQLLQQMERRNDSTQSIEQREWRRLLRGDAHFTTRPVTQAAVDAITRDDLVAFHREHYHPGRFIFAISGDVEPEEILPKIEARLDDWPATGAAVAAVPPPSHQPRPGLYAVDKDDVNQGRVSIGHLGTTRDNPDRYALIVMNDILGGGGFSARLLTRIRSDEGLAYGAYSSFGLGTYYEGTFRASFQSRSETVARAAAIVLEEIDRIRSEPVSEAELSTSIASFVETFSRNFSSAASTAGLFANDEYTGRDPSYIATYRERIAGVTAEDVLRVAREYLHPDQLVLLIVGDQATIAEGDPDNPDYTLDRLAEGAPTRIPLPDPFTMEYPSSP
ncbi:MAG: pitrilysin family protein [Acidobacteria bacterium]|nr:pitrilysin family protein [Acidobacteriota bacterium]